MSFLDKIKNIGKQEGDSPDVGMVEGQDGAAALRPEASDSTQMHTQLNTQLNSTLGDVSIIAEAVPTDPQAAARMH